MLAVRFSDLLGTFAFSFAIAVASGHKDIAVNIVKYKHAIRWLINDIVHLHSNTAQLRYQVYLARLQYHVIAKPFRFVVYWSLTSELTGRAVPPK